MPRSKSVILFHFTSGFLLLMAMASTLMAMASAEHGVLAVVQGPGGHRLRAGPPLRQASERGRRVFGFVWMEWSETQKQNST